MKEAQKKDWLKRLQNESWEPEILISGIVIYGLFKIFPYLEQLHLYLENYGSSFFHNSTVDDTVLALLQLSISWLILGFITHLFMRSFWVAYIGLSYVYGNEINFEKLKYHKSYLKTINQDNRISSNIEKLESICSSMFAISILFFMNVLGLIFFTSIIGFGVFLYIELFPNQTSFQYFDYVLQICIVICVIDYLTLGLFKRLPYINRVFFPIYKVVSLLTFAHLYRKIYYTFITNHKKWKVFLILIIFIVSSFFVMFFFRDGLSNSLSMKPNTFSTNVMAPGNYMDQAKDKFSKTLWITSQKIETQTLEAFVVHTTAYEENFIKPLCQYENRLQQDNVEIDQLKLDCLSQFYVLELNGNKVNSDFFYTTSYESNQDGLKYFVPIDSLSKGKHILKLYYNYYNSKEDTIYKRLRNKIEFYKSSPKTPRL